MKSRVGIFHPGTQHSWQTALAFQEAGTLTWYSTSIFYDPSRWPYKVEKYLPTRARQNIHREFSRRYLSELDPINLRLFGGWEWIQIAAGRIGAPRLQHQANKRGYASFNQRVIRLLEREPVDILIGYDTFSFEVFRWAKQRGIRCMLEQTIGHPRSLKKIMLAERDRCPEFFRSSYKEVSEELISQVDQELEIADVVMVGSDFCARTLVENGCPASKVAVVPYGFDESGFPKAQPIRPSLTERPVRFLFVGVASPRKGIAELLRAFENINLGDASLTIVGGLEIPARVSKRYGHRVTYVGQVPRSEVANYLVQSDCLVLPSLFEGSAVVLKEAIGAGLGIIQSSSAGDGVEDQKNGILLQEVSASSLEKALRFTIENRQRLVEWQNYSWATRPMKTWSSYRERIRQLCVGAT